MFVYLLLYPMVICSTGCTTGVVFLFPRNDNANDKLPIRPQYMRKIMIIFEIAFNSLVIPVDIPTVPIAENTSSSTSDMGIGCMAVISITAPIDRNRLVHNTALAFLITSSLNLLP